MRKQIDEVLNSQAKEQARFHEDNQEVLNTLQSAQEDLVDSGQEEEYNFEEKKPRKPLAILNSNDF